MRHRPVAIDSSARVMISQVYRALVRPGFADPVLDFGVPEPMFDEIPECWNVYGSAGSARGRDERDSVSSKCSDGPLGLAASPVTSKGDLIGLTVEFENLSPLPETLNRDSFDSGIMVRNRSVSGVAPSPSIECPSERGVVAAARVDNEGVRVLDFDPHPNGCEMSHRNNRHVVTSESEYAQTGSISEVQLGRRRGSIVGIRPSGLSSFTIG